MMPVKLPVTTLISLPMVILMIGLASRVATLRIRNKIGIGVASNKSLAKAMAAHGNAVENIPIALLLFALAEIQRANIILLSVCGVVFITGRIMNAQGVSRYAGKSFGRFYGTLMSWFVIIFLAFLNTWLNLSS